MECVYYSCMCQSQCVECVLTVVGVSRNVWSACITVVGVSRNVWSACITVVGVSRNV